MSDLTSFDTTETPGPKAHRALIGAAGLFVAELAAIGTIFKHSIDFHCLSNWPQQACSGASGTMVAIYCMMGALALLWMLAPTPFRTLVTQAGSRVWPLAINLVGALIALIPIAFLVEGSGTSSLLPAFSFWVLGMGAMLVGLGLFIAPLPRWRSFLAENWTRLVPVLAVGALAPSFATLIRPLWRSSDTIADLTFSAVAGSIRFLGYEVETLPAEKIIGTNDFAISVAPQCSGIEGFVLVTLFVTLYLTLFRADLRFPRALLLYPIGLAASAAFNVLRIALLLIIGLEGNPDLAVGGFHSHAGWLMFTLVALGLIALAQTVPALQKAQGPARTVAAPLPLLQDPVVARILPFAVFMLSALLASAFSTTPGLHYPARVILMAATLGLFWQIYRALPWRIDPVAVLAGAVIGAYWVLIPVDTVEAAAPYGALTGALLLGWYVMRGIGTIVLVPIIEELFFRDYLESRLRLGTGLAWKIMAALVTAGLFALLHDRWAEAFAAGLIFSFVMQRRGNVTDAILAHAVANAIVYGTALATGNLAII